MDRRGREEPAEPDQLDTRTQGTSADGDWRAVLGALLRSLDPRTRDIGLLHYLDGYTQEEVAVRTGFSRKTVGKKLKQFEERFRRA